MKPHEAWLFKAETDLNSARKLMQPPDEIPDTAIYHAQQSAEKALKGYLSFKGKSIIKTHDLSLLIELCLEFDADFDKISENASLLTPYGTLFRYPGISMVPDKEDVLEAIKKAEEIPAFIKKRI